MGVHTGEVSQWLLQASLCLISNGWMDIQGQGAVEALHANKQHKIKTSIYVPIHPSVESYRFLCQQQKLQIFKYIRACTMYTQQSLIQVVSCLSVTEHTARTTPHQ